MLIGGLQKTSLLDYPGKVSAIIFTAGCNFRCPYCYNPELVTKIRKTKLISQKAIFDFLAKRRNVLDAIVITGGEPTLHQDLAEFISKIKKLGFLVKLDTNGTNPAMIKKIIKKNLIDYIAMDIKAPLRSYSKVVNSKVDTKKIKHSIKIIINCGLAYEFRSTLLPQLHTRDDLLKMSRLVKGAKKYYLQKFKPTGNLNNQAFNNFKSFTDEQMKKLCEICRPYVEKCGIR